MKTQRSLAKPLFRRHALLTLALATAACLVAGPNAHAGFFMGLGIQDGDVRSIGVDLSDDGTVVLGVEASRAGQLWTESTGWQDILTSDDIPRAISGDGKVVVGQRDTDPATDSTTWEPMRWTQAGGVELLGFVDGSGSNFGRAWDANNDGSIVVGRSDDDAFRWVDGSGISALGSSKLAARGVNAAGDVLVGHENAGVAWRWESGSGFTTINDLTGGTSSFALSVSNDGAVVVGYAENAGTNNEAFRWKNGTITGLGDLPGGAFDSQANDTNVNGDVVVGYGTTASGKEAFIWSQRYGGLRNLEEFLTIDRNIVVPTGWTLEEAVAVSADGGIVLGTGINPDGDTEAFLAVIPEPASALVLGVTGLLAARRRRVRRG